MRGRLAGAAADGGGRRAAMRVALLAAFAAGLSIGGLGARLVPASEGYALVGAFVPALRAALGAPAVAFWLGSAALGCGVVALLWLAGLSVVGAPAAVAAVGLEGASTGFAAGLFVAIGGAGALPLVVAAVAVPAALVLPVWLAAAVEALAFALDAVAPAAAHDRARPRRLGRYAARGGLLALAAVALAAVESAGVRPVVALALRLSGL